MVTAQKTPEVIILMRSLSALYQQGGKVNDCIMLNAIFTSI